MKANNLKWIALTLAALLLIQSCKVYHKNTATLDEVILSQERVKVKMNSNETYEFDRIQRDEGLIYAYTKSSSVTAKKLLDRGLKGNLDGKYLKVLFQEESISEYHIQNKGLSLFLSIAIPVIIFCGALYFIALGSLNSAALL